MKLKQLRSEEKQVITAKHSERNFQIFIMLLIIGVTMIYPTETFATDMWAKASTMMTDIYNKILGISTISAVVCASICLLLMNFSRNSRTVDESRAWLKRIIITWVILNSLGFIIAYLKPLVDGGKYTG